MKALRTEKVASASAGDRTLRFLSNVDPVDVKRATDKLNPEETMAIIVSKTFTTRETSINAKTIKDWLIYHLVCALIVYAKDIVRNVIFRAIHLKL